MPVPMQYRSKQFCEGKINILYVSTLCSERLISDMLNLSIGVPHLAAQKFHRLLAQGMVLNEDLFNVNALSVPEYSVSKTGKRWIFNNSEVENGVRYTYAPVFLFPIIKWFIIAPYLLIKIIRWRLGSKYKHNYLVFDILNLSTSIISVFSSKIFRVKSVAIVTDLPEMLFVLKSKVTIIDKFSYRLGSILLYATNGYVFLTEAMNLTLNRKRKPCCIIEGMADIRLLSIDKKIELNYSTKVIHYSGGLYDVFGVKTLIDAFMLIDGDNIKLHLFGDGDLIGYINECKIKDPRIFYFGYKDNKEVINDQLKSFVLVNPRFTNEEYTKYSFPSKTIEYMASGIPLLTTKLPGIPFEYLSFVYLLEEENLEGYRNSIKKVLDKSKSEITKFGEEARNFVLKNKNNKIQAGIFYNHFINEM